MESALQQEMPRNNQEVPVQGYPTPPPPYTSMMAAVDGECTKQLLGDLEEPPPKYQQSFHTGIAQNWYGLTSVPVDTPTPYVYIPKPENSSAWTQEGGGGRPTFSVFLYGNDMKKVLKYCNKSYQLAFIRIVYVLIGIRLLAGEGLIALFLYYAPLKEFTQNTPAFWISAYATCIGFMVLLCVCPCFGRICSNSVAASFLYFGTLTLADGVLVAVFGAQFDLEILILTMGAFALVHFGVALFTLQTKWGLTRLNISLLVSFVVVIIFGIYIACLWQHFPIASMVIQGIWILILSLILVYDAKLLEGVNEIDKGKGKEAKQMQKV